MKDNWRHMKNKHWKKHPVFGFQKGTSMACSTSCSVKQRLAMALWSHALWRCREGRPSLGLGCLSKKTPPSYVKFRGMPSEIRKMCEETRFFFKCYGVKKKEMIRYNQEPYIVFLFLNNCTDLPNHIWELRFPLSIFCWEPESSKRGFERTWGHCRLLLLPKKCEKNWDQCDSMLFVICMLVLPCSNNKEIQVVR